LDLARVLLPSPRQVDRVVVVVIEAAADEVVDGKAEVERAGERGDGVLVLQPEIEGDRGAVDDVDLLVVGVDGEEVLVLVPDVAPDVLPRESSREIRAGHPAAAADGDDGVELAEEVEYGDARAGVLEAVA